MCGLFNHSLSTVGLLVFDSYDIQIDSFLYSTPADQFYEFSLMHFNFLPSHINLCHLGCLQHH